MARTMSPDEYQELGRRYFKLKEYDKAVVAFTEGIEASVIPSVGLYDHRAASYDRLNDFSAAVKDGRAMIKLNKADIKGYLRTANVLEKMNKLDTAVNIYKYGMKNVPITNKNFMLLQQLHDKLTRKLSPAKAVDPFTILPVELVEMIMGYLNFRNMVNCLRVSKGWKNYLTKRRNLWTDLDFSGARKDVSRSFVRNAVNHSEYLVHRVAIYRFKHVDVLRNLATACKQLTVFELLSPSFTMSETLVEIVQCAMNLKKLVVRHEISTNTVTRILRFRPTLEHAEFTSIKFHQGFGAPVWRGPWPKLHTLRLSGHSIFDLTRIDLATLIPCAESLRSLTVTNFFLTGDLPDFATLPLTHLVLSNARIPHALPSLPSSLTHLQIHHCNMVRLPIPGEFGLAESGINAIKAHLPNLTHISFANLGNLTSTFLSVLLDTVEGENGQSQPAPSELDSVSSLRHVALRDVDEVCGDAGLLASSPRVLSGFLESLDLAKQNITDAHIEWLVTQKVNGLQSINLSLTNISGAGVKMLVDNLQGLRSLTVDQCPNITSRDVIAYAENKGISVSCKWAQQSGGGRKVRYYD